MSEKRGRKNKLLNNCCVAEPRNCLKCRELYWELADYGLCLTCRERQRLPKVKAGEEKAA